MQSLFLAASEGCVNISGPVHGFSLWILWGMNRFHRLFLSFILDSNHKDFWSFRWTTDSSDVSTCHSNWLFSSFFLCLRCSRSPAVIRLPFCLFLLRFWHFVYSFQALLQPANDCFSCEKRVLAPTPWQLQGSGRKRGRAVMAADIHSLSVIFTEKAILWVFSEGEGTNCDCSVLTLSSAGRTRGTVSHGVTYETYSSLVWEQRTQCLKALRGPMCPPCRASTTAGSTAEPPPSSKTTPTPSTDCLHFCPPAGGTEEKKKLFHPHCSQTP